MLTSIIQVEKLETILELTFLANKQLYLLPLPEIALVMQGLFDIDWFGSMCFGRGGVRSADALGRLPCG